MLISSLNNLRQEGDLPAPESRPRVERAAEMVERKRAEEVVVEVVHVEHTGQKEEEDEEEECLN